MGMTGAGWLGCRGHDGTVWDQALVRVRGRAGPHKFAQACTGLPTCARSCWARLAHGVACSVHIVHITLVLLLYELDAPTAKRPKRLFRFVMCHAGPDQVHNVCCFVHTPLDNLPGGE